MKYLHFFKMIFREKYLFVKNGENGKIVTNVKNCIYCTLFYYICMYYYIYYRIIIFYYLKVSPSELEDVIRCHPAVAEVSVIGIPDDYAGELPRAFVVSKKSASVTQQDLIDFVDARVSKVKKLKGGVEFVNSLPKSSTGKNLRREIRDAYIKSK